MLEKFKIDLEDPAVFPNQKKCWRSYIENLASEGLNQTKHYEEINPETISKLYNLFNNLRDCIK